MRKILSLNPHLDGLPVWKDAAVPVTSLDPGFHLRSRAGQLFFLLRNARRFELILIPNDLWLAAMFRLLAPAGPGCARVALLGFYYDANPCRQGLRAQLRHAKYKFLARAVDRIIVHTSTEIALCSESLGLDASRFEFIPYYAYDDAIGTLPGQDSIPGKPLVLAPGRHRDFACFCKAVTGLNGRAAIVCGTSDLSEVQHAAFGSQIEIHSEVPLARYRELMGAADIVVIPLFAVRWQRSLGQIAWFDAALMNKPVVIARTFHLADYVSENEALFYEPGDAADLRRQLERLLGSPQLRASLAANAFRRVRSEFTEERFAAALAAACQRWL
ncbi:MAG TPA: glycosyltransferase family 4 protein [Bryobacteraceae bacterium]|nr:glycosyltransferase family 4 protein [Bryobacteraceae bacterium]